jgi:membrane-anchored protein YejM (alkaline phosphatase superfamily)
MLTQEQMDIINLAGQAKDTPFATYKLELDSNENVKEFSEQQQKIPEFFNPTYNHPAQVKYQAPTKPVQATDPQPVAPK